jgi:hypothetical protein
MFVDFQVEFFDARIYEETLNILLYENRRTSVDEIIRVTTTRVGSNIVINDDFDDDRTLHSLSPIDNKRTQRKP